MTNGKLANQYPSEDGEYTDLQVCQSAAGYYVGTMFNNNAGFQEPGSRESEYFTTRQAAEDALASESWIQRPNP